MSQIIQFLENMGKNPSIARLDPDAFAASVDALSIDSASRSALLSKDSKAIGRMLGAKDRLQCILFKPEQDGRFQCLLFKPEQDDVDTAIPSYATSADRH